MLRLALMFLFAAGAPLLWAQAEYRVYNDHPRIWLDEGRLKRLSRDAERETLLWIALRQQLSETGRTSEPALALALAYRASGDEEFGRRAVGWALEAVARGFSQSGDLRQAAIVFDWCFELLSEPQREGLVDALADAAAASTQLSGLDLSRVRDGLLASVALAGEWDDSERALAAFVENQWAEEILPALQAGGLVDDGAQLIALLEICHVVRNNLERDLWQDAPDLFRSLPTPRILSYLPGAIEGEEGRLRRSALFPPDADPAREAALWRIAEMLLVGYDSVSRDFQFLQGWLRSDAYTLRGPLGAVYEFLWVNPYLPGLSPRSGPALAHDPARGRLFARRGWEESDLWVGYWASQLRIYSGGELHVIDRADKQAPLEFAGASVALPEDRGKFNVSVGEANEAFGKFVYLIGLDPAWKYEVKVAKRDWRTYEPETGGIIIIREETSPGRKRVDFAKPVRVQIRKGARISPSQGKPPTLGP